MSDIKVARSHFDDCPYGCNPNGMLLDTTTGEMVQCPHCSERKRSMVRQGYVETETDETVPLSTVLGIENKYLTSSFEYDVVIPEGEQLFIDNDSMRWQREESTNLYQGLSLGNAPEYSMCFGISVKGRIDRFAYPMLSKAYLSGLSIAKFISCTEFCRLQFNMNESLDVYYSADFLMMLINDGSNLAEISSAKGLMQSRALKGKPTVFLTTWTIEACSGLLGFKDDSDYFLAKPIFVSYKKGKSKGHSSYINNLLGVNNEQVGFGDSMESDIIGEDLDGGVPLADLLS